MMHRLLAKADENQAKADANREAMLAAIKANGETTTRMAANMGSLRDALKSAIREIRFSREETMACEEKTEGRLEEVEEPASVDMTPEVADEEVPGQDAEVVPAGEPGKKRQDRRHLAAERRQRKEQGRAQRKHGCLKRLVATRRGTTCRAVVARRRILFSETTRSGLIVAAREVTRRVQVARRNNLPRKDTARKDLAATGREETRRTKVTRHRRNRRKKIATGGNHIRDKTERGTQRTLALEKRFWTRQIGRAGPEDSSGGPYVASRKIKCWILWRGRPPPKRKKKWRKKSRVWGAPATLRASAPCVCESAARKSERM
jgi:hypothetical protein